MTLLRHTKDDHHNHHHSKVVFGDGESTIGKNKITIFSRLETHRKYK